MATTSKFWNAGQFSGSDESSDSGSESSVSVEKVETKAPVVASRWAARDDDSSSDEDEKRVVKSAKEKQWENLKQIIRSMNNHKNIDDFAELLSGMEALIRGLNKARMVVEKEGIPGFFLQALAQLEDYISVKFMDKESLKKLTKAKGTSFNILRSKARKTMEEYRELIDEWRRNPKAFAHSDSNEASSPSGSASSSGESFSSSETYESSEEESENESVFEEGEKAVAETKAARGTTPGYASSEDWKSDDESYASDRPAPAAVDSTMEAGLKRWGKKEPAKKKKVSTKDKKKSHTKAKTKVIAAEIQASSRPDKMPIFQPGEKIDSKLISKKLKEIIAIRGRKGFDRNDQIRQLLEINEVASAFGPQTQLEALNHLISAYFDANLGAFNAISLNQWIKAYEHLTTAIHLLRENSDTYLPLLTFEETAQNRNLALISELEQEAASVVPNISMVPSTFTQPQTLMDENSIKDFAKMRTNSDLMLATYLERLDDELIKALQLASINTDEYEQRLGQAIDMLVLACKALMYFKKENNVECQKAISFRILEHFYYINKKIATAMWDVICKKLDATTLEQLTANKYNADNIVELLCRECLQKTDDTKFRVRLILYQAYHYCLNQRYHEARDLIQTGNLVELAMQCNVPTQVLYNRCLAQLGFAAFSLGLTTEAHASLMEVCNMGRYRELLAQGLSNLPRGVEKSPEQERMEKRRILPYHMHISADLVETIHNICAMLIEVPLMTANSLDYGKRIVSRNFRRQLDMYERQIFIAPPENPRETVLAATIALQKADWKKCYAYIQSLKFWETFPQSDLVKSRIKQRIQEEALRTYVYRYSCHYASFNVHTLANMFDLPVSVTHSILSKMMIQSSLSGSWNEAAECVMITRIEKSSLQHLALQLTEKLGASSEQLEQMSRYRDSKFVLTQISQRDERTRRFEDRWYDRRAFGPREDWGNMNFGSYQRWDHAGATDSRQYRYPKHHTYLGDNRVDQRMRKRVQ